MIVLNISQKLKRSSRCARELEKLSEQKNDQEVLQSPAETVNFPTPAASVELIQAVLLCCELPILVDSKVLENLHHGLQDNFDESEEQRSFPSDSVQVSGTLKEEVNLREFIFPVFNRSYEEITKAELPLQSIKERPFDHSEVIGKLLDGQRLLMETDRWPKYQRKDFLLSTSNSFDSFKEAALESIDHNRSLIQRLG